MEETVNEGKTLDTRREERPDGWDELQEDSENRKMEDRRIKGEGCGGSVAPIRSL